MNSVSSSVYIDALFILMISSIFTYIFVINRLLNEKNQSISVLYYMLYFIVGVIGWGWFWLKELGVINVDLSASVIFYLLTSLLLLLAIMGRKWNTKPARIAIIIHAFLITGSLWLDDDLSDTLFLDTYAIIIYPLICYLSFKRARNENNMGYAIIGVSAMLSIVVVPAQLFSMLILENNDLAYGVSIISTSTGFTLIGIGFLASALIDKNNQLIMLALKDPLTGLFNRRGLEQAMTLSLSMADRNDDFISAIALDVDHFKNINDTYGHDCGDYVLKELADILTHHARPSDACCRLGGEEFVIVLPTTTGQNAFQVAERLRQHIENTILHYEDTVIRMTSSFGVATQHKKVDMNELIKEADQALYQAKASGRNRVCYSPSK